MTTPTDPLFSQQWHFNLLGNVEAIWDDYTGAGVSVGVYDEGIQYSHFDLNDNYDASLHVVFNGNSFDGVNHSSGAAHGTSVAGLIAAENNGIDTVGVAYGASITGVNIFDPRSAININANSPAGFYAAAAQTANFDIANHSWGSLASFTSGQNLNVASSFAAQTVAAYENGIDHGRGGLGTIIVQSAGNDARDANADGINASRFTVTVAALSQTGQAASYSNHGASILVSAGGGELAANGGLGPVTTDLLGNDGYNLRDGSAGTDYTNDFVGTSASAPIVSGVVALILDANADLGWRDVQNILALSGTHTGSSLTATTPGAFENGNWIFTSGSNWNGGAMHVHTNYGYGSLNAYNAVRIAEAYALFADDAQTSANEMSVTVGSTPALALPDLATVSVQFTVTDAIDIEHVAITTGITHSFWSDLVITLITPDGDRIVLADGAVTNSSAADRGLTWTFGVDQLRGLSSAGTWTLEITDKGADDIGTFNTLSATFYGSAPTNNDVYHFTDEFQTLAALDPSRRTLTDTDGGTDWLNLAALSGDLNIQLLENSTSTQNGVTLFTISAGSEIENLVAGDGNDQLFGTFGANTIYGMRGDDTIGGIFGADLLNGGEGNDTIYGDDDDDILIGGSGNDDLNGGNQDDTLNGGFDNDSLFGGDGDDRLIGGGGVDFLLADAGDDILNGGRADVDQLYGGVGDDIYLLADTLDTVFEFLDEGIDTVRSFIDYILGDNLERLSLQGVGRNATGNALDNVISGSNGADTLSGLDGDDVLRGHNGRDILSGGEGDDLLDGGAGFDTMTGGAGGDIFQFRDGDFQNTRRLADTITDFDQLSGDHIMLNLVDANINETGDQDFIWLGTGRFTNQAGELHYRQLGGNTYIEGDTNGDGIADLIIRLDGLIALTDTDLVGADWGI